MVQGGLSVNCALICLDLRNTFHSQLWPLFTFEGWKKMLFFTFTNDMAASRCAEDTHVLLAGGQSV